MLNLIIGILHEEGIYTDGSWLVDGKVVTIDGESETATVDGEVIPWRCEHGKSCWSCMEQSLECFGGTGEITALDQLIAI